MTHKLEHKFEMVTVSFRYQCECANKEVLTISVVMDKHTFNRKEHFHNVMEAAYLDVQSEIAAHLKPQEPVHPPGTEQVPTS